MKNSYLGRIQREATGEKPGKTAGKTRQMTWPGGLWHRAGCGIKGQKNDRETSSFSTDIQISR